MKMIHKNCGGEIKESETLTPYISEEYGTAPAYECLKCQREILGDYQIQFIPTSICQSCGNEYPFYKKDTGRGASSKLCPTCHGKVKQPGIGNSTRRSKGHKIRNMHKIVPIKLKS